MKDDILLAIKATDNCYNPYSKFYVGACLITKSGKRYLGCNIENKSFTPTICAERTAFFKAISEGEKEFDKIIIVGGKNKVFDNYCPPCGVCRQVMKEFCNKDFKIILAKDNNEYLEYTLDSLLPNSF